MTVLDNLPTHDVNVFLHELRMRRLAQMPVEGPVVLSGGAANQHYFDWFAEHYPGHVERHIAVELFSPAPDPLPEGVEWLARTLGDLSPVGDDEVDLVFAGQVIEHMWPHEVAGFLTEAGRVLRPGGALVIDSPTRFVTAALGWTQPEHTIELEVDEIVDLLRLAGFIDIEVKGIWLCYDRDRGRVLPLDIFSGGQDWSWQRRVIEAEDRPHDSFIWWAEARNHGGRDDAAALNRRVHDIYNAVRPTYFQRMRTEIGEPADHPSGPGFSAAPGRDGLVLSGPSIALPAGRHEAVIRLHADGAGARPGPGQRVAEVEVTRDAGQVVAHLSLAARDLPAGGAPREVVLPFELSDTAFNGELRVRSLGIVPVFANVPVAVQENVGSVRTPSVRPLGPDASRVRRQAVLRTARRVLGWPARRLLDPRMQGLRNHGQWLAGTVVDRIDARAGELGTRIDALAERVQPRSIESTSVERSAVLPFVLRALGSLTSGSTILVTEEDGGAVSAVLGSLGYRVVRTQPSRRVAGAVIRTTSTEDAGIAQAIETVQPAGSVVLIIETADHAEIEHLLDGWEIQNRAVTEPQGNDGPSLTLISASLVDSTLSGSIQQSNV